MKEGTRGEGEGEEGGGVNKRFCETMECLVSNERFQFRDFGVDI